MFRSTPFIVLALLLGCLTISCSKKSNAGSSASMFPSAVDSGNYFKTPFQDESQYIVENIATDIAEMAFYAKNKKLPGRDQFVVQASEGAGSGFRAPIYDVQITFSKKSAPIKVKVPVAAGIWSPEVYESLTGAIFQNLQEANNPASQDADDKSILTSLTVGTAVAIAEANEVVSSALQVDFRNPGLHEQAAVVLGAFVLRDHANDFTDYRWPLCRITAHLAIARQLNEGKLGLNGRYASIMLNAAINNQKIALEQLSNLDGADSYLEKWNRVLRAYITADYRPFGDGKKLDLFEKTAWFYAMSRSVDVGMAWATLKQKEMMVSDYSRIAFATDYSVQMGHQLQAIALYNELNEAKQVYEVAHKKELIQQEIVDALNKPPLRLFRKRHQRTAESENTWLGYLGEFSSATYLQ